MMINDKDERFFTTEHQQIIFHIFRNRNNVYKRLYYFSSVINTTEIWRCWIHPVDPKSWHAAATIWRPHCLAYYYTAVVHLAFYYQFHFRLVAATFNYCAMCNDTTVPGDCDQRHFASSTCDTRERAHCKPNQVTSSGVSTFRSLLSAFVTQPVVSPGIEASVPLLPRP